MISYLLGQVKKQDDEVIILTNGVGYGVHIGAQTLRKLSDGEEAELYIHTHVREDEISLFGFVDHQQKKLFLTFINISGVGPKTALTITDLGASSVITAVQEADVAFFTQVPRVGKKLAQKIIIELKNKLGSIRELNLAETSEQTELSEALLGLGFSNQHIQLVMQQLDTENKDLETNLRSALKLLGKSS